jgi:hypothetical protein
MKGSARAITKFQAENVHTLTFRSDVEHEILFICVVVRGGGAGVESIIVQVDTLLAPVCIAIKGPVKQCDYWTATVGSGIIARSSSFDQRNILDSVWIKRSAKHKIPRSGVFSMPAKPDVSCHASIERIRGTICIHTRREAVGRYCLNG